MAKRDDRQDKQAQALALSRRAWLQGIGATALLAACGETAIDLPVAETDTSTGGDGTVGVADAGKTGDAAADVAADTVTKAPGLSPITPVEDYYITSSGITPNVDFETWTLQFLDRGTLLATLDRKQLDALLPRDKEHTLECIGGGPSYPLISNGIWTGLPLPEIFAKLGFAAPTDTSGVKVSALDGYKTAIPAADVALPVWLVWRLNGQPLPPQHGYPARLLVPGRYGMKNPKWVSALEFIDEPFAGYWESKGWSDSAVYRPNTYIMGPAPGRALDVGPVDVYGTAFAGRDPIARVEFRVDDGPWQDAKLDYNGGPDIWTLWRFTWNATKGDHTVQARCTTKSGLMSDPRADGDGDWASGYNGSAAAGYLVG